MIFSCVLAVTKMICSAYLSEIRQSSKKNDDENFPDFEDFNFKIDFVDNNRGSKVEQSVHFWHRPLSFQMMESVAIRT